VTKKVPQKNIRNFSIIAHIDHGKSTLADRIIQECGAVSDRQMSAQVMMENTIFSTLLTLRVTLTFHMK